MSKLSICVTVKNRSSVHTEDGTLHLFPNLIKSLANSLTMNMDAELIITDWESTDWPIRTWIEDYMPNIPIHLITVKSDKFSAGRGRNIAADYATGDVILFIDADMLITKEVIDFAMERVSPGTVYYPTVHYYTDPVNWYIHGGGGNFFISRTDFEATKKWPEYYAHGFEDTDLYRDIKKRCDTMVHAHLYIEHQYHPQDKQFKDKFATQEGKDKIAERKQFHLEEPDLLMKEAQKTLHAPNTTHYKLHPVAKGI